MEPIRFHLAFPVTDIPLAKTYYGEGLGCEIGRESPASVILNLYGHQLVAHLTHEELTPQRGIYPRHFGLIFPAQADWESLAARAQARELLFYQEPRWRFIGSPLEHGTFFLQDPFYNLLEFKYYRHASAIFGERELALIGDREG
ncbi:glyoxalase [Synechococcus sp. Nb3U1]|uniref:VOC family protein n=1 Tax=Synechococcus sp. Nb3U1 TaxID=1914529 RepID=UPI001F415426|nr:VOC family protein [Synechococcus sp. Nb3U1]MCF2970990.1 glyoxalase [Synechococcus sp. Nb3U1]